MKHYLLTSGVALGGWIACETVGGLLFLALGVRLWEYYLTPVFWNITSYFGWLMVWLVAGSSCFLYLCWERSAGLDGRRRWLGRAVFLMIAGPVHEVVWNSIIWSVVGTPLYLYHVLPTFAGSGSLLSPTYYLTLLLGFWVEERIPGSLAGWWRVRLPSKSGCQVETA